MFDRREVVRIGAQSREFFFGDAQSKKKDLEEPKRVPKQMGTNTMLGANLSDQIPGGPNLTLTLTLNSN